jgi:hypothetical protein
LGGTTFNYDVVCECTFHARPLAVAVLTRIGLVLPDLRTKLTWGAGAALLLALVGTDFVLATTFLGDDHVFRAFARLEPSPWVAFVSDKHGGEYYRPVPMMLWWVLERLGAGSAWPFALSQFLLHATCAALLLVVAGRLGMSPPARALAGALFLVAPAEREAALWFSASTDLLAAAAMLGSLAGLLSRRKTWRLISLFLAAIALLSKETALVLPLLVGAICWYRGGFRDRQENRTPSPGEIVTSMVPYWVVAALYLAARFWVLRGLGGNNDPRAPVWAMGLQIVGGWVHAVSAYAPLPEWAAWLLGGSALVAAGVALRSSRAARLGALWAVIAVLPLPAAGWVVGARYFYFSTAGLMLLLALALESRGTWLPTAVLVVLLGLGAVAANRRASEVGLYLRAVAAARDGVADGLAKGRRLFLVRGAVKDLDLAIKLDPKAPAAVREAVVIPDVPASFVWLPGAEMETLGGFPSPRPLPAALQPARFARPRAFELRRAKPGSAIADRLAFLFADPPLPPSGAYHFADQRIVGLARREDAPDLDTVLSRLPDLRILRLKLGANPAGWEDCTAEYVAPE